MLDSISAKTAERIAIVLTGICLSSAALALAEALSLIPSTGPWAGTAAGTAAGAAILFHRARRG
jgi:hypothetical protein